MGHFGSFLGHFGNFGSFLGQFGKFWVIFGLFWVILGHFWAIFWCWFFVAKYAFVLFKSLFATLLFCWVEFDLCAISGAFQLHRSNMIQYFSKTFFSQKECLGLLREMNRFKESGLLRLTSTGKCKVIHSVGNISTYCQ